MESSDTISQLRYLETVLHILPTHDQICNHILYTRHAFIRDFTLKVKQVCVFKRYNKIKTKKALESARRKAKRMYELREKSVPTFDKFVLNSEDGWKNKMRTQSGNIVFVYKGHIIECDDLCTKIFHVTQSQILKFNLEYLHVIFHLHENECKFDEQFLNNTLNAIKAIANTTYSDYLPLPPKLRRSYNCNLYDQVASIVVEEGWKSKQICNFDVTCYIFQLDGIKYTVDTHDNLIDKIMQF